MNSNVGNIIIIASYYKEEMTFSSDPLSHPLLKLATNKAQNYNKIIMLNEWIKNVFF